MRFATRFLIANLETYTKQYLDSDGTWHYIVKKPDGVMEYYLNKSMEASSSQFDIYFKEYFYDDEIIFFVHALTSNYDVVPVPKSYTGSRLSGRITSPPSTHFQLFAMMVGRWK